MNEETESQSYSLIRDTIYQKFLQYDCGSLGCVFLTDSTTTRIMTIDRKIVVAIDASNQKLQIYQCCINSKNLMQCILDISNCLSLKLEFEC